MKKKLTFSDVLFIFTPAILTIGVFLLYWFITSNPASKKDNEAIDYNSISFTTSFPYDSLEREINSKYSSYIIDSPGPKPNAICAIRFPSKKYVTVDLVNKKQLPALVHTLTDSLNNVLIKDDTVFIITRFNCSLFNNPLDTVRPFIFTNSQILYSMINEALGGNQVTHKKRKKY